MTLGSGLTTPTDDLDFGAAATGASAVLRKPGSAALVLPTSGWDLRIGRGSHLRPALEVRTGDGLIDVAVSGGLDQTLLRGALRGRNNGQAWAIAWGHLPRNTAGTEPATRQVTVEFRNGHTSLGVPATTLADAFWVAEAPGEFRSVAVAGVSPDGAIAQVAATPADPHHRAGTTTARLRRYRRSR